MRIGVNTRILIEGKLEGIGLFTHEVMKRVVAKMPDDEFYFFFDRRPAEQFLYSDNVKGIIVSPQARHPILWYIWFEHSLKRAIRKYGIDLLFSPDGYNSLRADIPTVLTIHDLAFHHYKSQVPFLVHKYYNYYTPKFVNKADHILTVSQFTKQDIQSAYQTAAEKISVVGNGCDKAIRPLNDQQKQMVRAHYTEKAPYFIYIGSIHPRKNTARLLRAFDEFKERYESDIKLVLAGRWAWKTKGIRRVYNRLKNKGDVICFGHIDRVELGKLLATSIGLVYPSLFEGFGIPVLEAMYADVPVITSRDSSMSEVAGEAALYVDPENVNEISRAMEKIAKDFNLSDQLVQAGKVQRRAFSWDITADKVVASLQDLKGGIKKEASQ